MQVEYCPFFTQHKCRSCSLLQLEEEERNAHRLEALEKLARPVIGKAQIREIVKPDDVNQSRCKVKLSVSGSIRNPIIGLIDNHLQGVELLDCPLHYKALNAVVREVKSLITDFRLTPYNIDSQEGELKGLILTANHDGSSVILRFVLKSDRLISRIEKSLAVIRKRTNQVKVVSVNIQPVPHAILEGEEEIVLTEQKQIWLNYLGKSIAVGPQSFVQVTPSTAMQLYDQVGKLFEVWRPDGFMDLYCGSGAFSFFAAPHSSWGIGVETSTNAIDCAVRGAKRNGLEQLRFVAADTKDYLETYADKAPEVIIANPPRRGLDPVVVSRICELKPKHFVYSSCNPETLIGDLEVMTDLYAVKSLTPFDMFPMTEHLEVLAVLNRRR